MSSFRTRNADVSAETWDMYCILLLITAVLAYADGADHMFPKVDKKSGNDFGTSLLVIEKNHVAVAQ